MNLSEGFRKRLGELAGITNDSNSFSPNYIIKYVNGLHKKGWEKKKFEDPERILAHSHFLLKEISLDDPSIKWCNDMHYPVSVNYSKLETDIPAIVIDSDGFIIDGCHRLNAQRIKGAKTIWAYIGIK